MTFLFKTLLVLTLYSQFLADEKVRYDNFQVHRITPKTEKAVESLKYLEDNPSGYDLWSSVRGVNHPVDIMVPPHMKYRFNDLVRSGEFDSQVFINNVQELIDNEKPKTEVGAEFGWTEYHTLDEINAWLKEVASGSDYVSLINIGQTYEGRDILGVWISFAPGFQDRSVFIEANIHAREWITSAVATYILNEVLNNNDTTIRYVAETHDWFIVPVFNPDGFAYTHTTDRMWRKTRTPYGVCYGADPNRNWDYHYNEGGTSSNTCSETYRGPNAFSEASTKSASEFISKIGDELQAYISFHSYSQLLLLPYGYSAEHLNNYDDLYTVGVKAAQSLAQRYNTQYQVGNIVEILYVASGGSVDWVKGTYNTQITYTYELRDTGRYGFILPPEQIIPTAEETFDSLVTILQEFDRINGFNN